ncbi:MAG: hypothetical protein K0R00_175 [Herbinix sp.]|jgi:hypothetical protein|nr:hypothetical protein [Herbinix sp.]
MMNPYFNPSSLVHNNIQKYAGSGAKSNVAIYPCIIQKIYNNLRVDIYIPYTSTIMESLPLIFDSFSEEQGNITMPEENSMSLFISSSDGHRFVYGGLSLSENYIVRNILPGEAERYVKNSSYKQDVLGNHIFLSRLCSTEIYGEDGLNQSYSNGKYYDDKNTEEFSGTILMDDQTSRLIKIKRIYSQKLTTPKYNGKSISKKTQSTIIQRNENATNKILDYLVGIQNLKEDFSEDNIALFKKSVHESYRYQRKLCIIVEEGSAVNKEVIDQSELEQLTSSNIVYASDQIAIIYRVRTFNESGDVTSSFSVSESGITDFWEKSEEIILKHNLDDYPVVSLMKADTSRSCLKAVNCEVAYMDRYTVKISLKRKYGVVKTITCNGSSFEITMTNDDKFYAELSSSPKKLEEMVKQIMAKQ